MEIYGESNEEVELTTAYSIRIVEEKIQVSGVSGPQDWGLATYYVWVEKDEFHALSLVLDDKFR